LLINVT